MSRRALGVLIACFLVVFISYASRYSYGVILPEMLTPLAISKTQAGVIYASYFVAYTVLSPILGILSDKINVRVLLTVFVAILGIGTLLMSFSSSLFHASFFYAIAGIGAAACWAPVMAVAQRWTSDKRRGMTLSFIDAGTSLGIVAAGAVIPLIVLNYGWSMGWMTMGIMSLFTAVINLIFIRSRPAEKAQPPDIKYAQHTGKQTSINQARFLYNITFWLIGLAYLLVGSAIIIPFTFLSTYAVQELAMSYEAATGLITVIGIAALIGKLVLGPLSDTIGRIRIMMMCSVLVAMGALGMAYFKGIWLLTIFTAIFGVGYGTIWSMYAAASSDYFSKKYAGSIVGIWTFLVGAGCIIYPIIAGWIADSTGTIAWSFVVAGASAIVSLFLLLPVWKGRSLFLTEEASVASPK